MRITNIRQYYIIHTTLIMLTLLLQYAAITNIRCGEIIFFFPSLFISISFPLSLSSLYSSPSLSLSPLLLSLLSLSPLSISPLITLLFHLTYLPPLLSLSFLCQVRSVVGLPCGCGVQRMPVNVLLSVPRSLLLEIG